MTLPRLGDGPRTVARAVAALRTSCEFGSNITHFEHLPALPARYADWPGWLDPRLRRALAELGIERL